MPDEGIRTKRPSLKILVIEDDELTRITLCRIFARMNYATVEAANGAAGLHVFKEEKPDIVLTDMLMPGQGGLEIIKEIRALNPGVKIIAMSGGASQNNVDILDLARRCGATFSLPKPFRPDDILILLQSLQLQKA